jgi:hypothetical protein
MLRAEHWKARNQMTYQINTIKKLIKERLRSIGQAICDDSMLGEMIERNIPRLNPGEYIAVDIDSSGLPTSVKRVIGFDSLGDISENAILISFQQLERYFNEQQHASMEF